MPIQVEMNVVYMYESTKCSCDALMEGAHDLEAQTGRRQFFGRANSSSLLDLIRAVVNTDSGGFESTLGNSPTGPILFGIPFVVDDSVQGWRIELVRYRTKSALADFHGSFTITLADFGGTRCPT